MTDEPSVDVPDTLEMRLARLETRAEVAKAELEANRRQIQAIAPLTAQYAVLQSQLLDLDGDVKALKSEIELRAERLEKRYKEEQDRFALRIENQLLACTAEIKRVETGMDQERKDLTNARRNLNLALIAGVFAIAASLVSSILPNLLG
jgi:chromosome segregation ATPase